jgi:hypothetical protein
MPRDCNFSDRMACSEVMYALRGTGTEYAACGGCAMEGTLPYVVEQCRSGMG